MRMPDVLIITVNYQGANATARFLEGASRLEDIGRAHLLVVENGSNDGSAEKLRPLIADTPNAELIESATNLGYFGAANWALQQYLQRALQPDWVIVCNNDLLFRDQQFFSKLLRRNPQEAAVLAPAIVDQITGVDCNPFMRRRPSSFRWLRIRFWHASFYFLWVKQFLSPYVRSLRYRLRSQVSSDRQQGPSEVYAAHGAMFIFSRRYFEAGGYIDDGHFLYAEELCVAEICLRLGLKIVHEPDLRVWHQSHHVTGRLLTRSGFLQAKGAIEYVQEKHFRTVH